MSTTIWACPIDGLLPADNGTDQTKTNNVVGSGATGDVNGNPPHCPMCGTAAVVVDQTKVQTLTGVVAASQTAANIDSVYVTQADSPLAQQGSVATITGQTSRVVHGYPSVHQRGTVVVTPETVNTVTAE